MDEPKDDGELPQKRTQAFLNRGVNRPAARRIKKLALIPLAGIPDRSTE
jgi:hypothetical protein